MRLLSHLARPLVKGTAFVFLTAFAIGITVALLGVAYVAYRYGWTNAHSAVTPQDLRQLLIGLLLASAGTAVVFLLDRAIDVLITAKKPKAK
jgi:hypothetical protein